MSEEGFLLIVDDSPMNVRLAVDTLEDAGHRVISVDNALDGIDIVRKEHPDVVLMDVIMPGLTGYEATRTLKADPATSDTRIIIVSAKASPKDIVIGFNSMADDYLTKPYYPQVLLARVGMQMELLTTKRLLIAENVKLERKMFKNKLSMQNSYESIFYSLASLAEVRTNMAKTHMKKIGQCSQILAIELRKMNKYSSLITDEYIQAIPWAAQLHDIGEIGVPDYIMEKECHTDEEHEIFKNHSKLGGKIFSNTIEQMHWQPSLQLMLCREIATHHHERFDGTGYPMGLTGSEIPLSARLVSLADAFEEGNDCHLCSNAKSGNKIEKMLNCAGDHFDPDIVRAFEINLPLIEKISGGQETSSTFNINQTI